MSTQASSTASAFDQTAHSVRASWFERKYEQSATQLAALASLATTPAQKATLQELRNKQTELAGSDLITNYKPHDQ